MLTCTFENGQTASLRHVVVDNLVARGTELLLVKRAEGLHHAGKWCLPGGYVERDETITQAATREIMEETGYEVSNLELLRIKDNPDRRGETRQNISFVHMCVAGERIGEPDAESPEQRWFSLDELPTKEEIAFDHFDNIQLYLTT